MTTHESEHLTDDTMPHVEPDPPCLEEVSQLWEDLPDDLRGILVACARSLRKIRHWEQAHQR